MNFTKIIQEILSPGPALFMPVVFFIFVIIIKIIRKDAITWVTGIRSALTIGIAFVAISIVIGFLINSINPAFIALQNLKNFSFGSLDLGWAPIAAIAWAWQWAFLMFPIQIIINLIMLLTKTTKTLNIDMWNVWNKIITAILVIFLVGDGALGLALGFVIGAIQVIMELKNADYTYHRIYQLTKIERVACPHSMLLFNIVLWPFERLLNLIPWFTRGDVHQNETHFGSFGNNARFNKYSWLIENDIIGILIGILLMIIALPFAPSAWATYVILPFQIAAALILFPLATKLFSKAISPLSSSVQKIITQSKQKFDLYIGLDWPFLAGNNKMWVVSTIIIPFSIAFSFIFALIPNIKMVFPLGGLVNIVLAVSLLVVCQGNIRKMIFLGIFFTPIYLFFGAWAADAITALALESKISNIPENAAITWSGFESPVWRFISANILQLFVHMKITTANLIGIIVFVPWLFMTIIYYWFMRAESKGIEKPFAKLLNYFSKNIHRSIN